MEKGSSWGHNGLRSIEKYLGQDYARLRFGIGHDFNPVEQSNYVLQQFSNDEKKKIYDKKMVVIKLIQNFITKY